MAGLGMITEMNNDDIQKWLRKINETELRVAILAVDKEVRKRIFENMSTKAR